MSVGARFWLRSPEHFATPYIHKICILPINRCAADVININVNAISDERSERKDEDGTKQRPQDGRRVNPKYLTSAVCGKTVYAAAIARLRPRERGSGQLGDGGSPNGIPSHVLPQSKFLTHLLNIIREGRWTPGATEAVLRPG